MKNSIFILIVISWMLSCSNNPKEEKAYPENLFSIIQTGKSIEKSYTFCSTVAIDVKYNVRVGVWEFKEKNGKLIAKGEYDSKIVEIGSHGGCPYYFTRNIVDLDKWEFWNFEGEKIEPTERLKFLIKMNLY